MFLGETWYSHFINPSVLTMFVPDQVLHLTFLSGKQVQHPVINRGLPVVRVYNFCKYCLVGNFFEVKSKKIS